MSDREKAQIDAAEAYWQSVAFYKGEQLFRLPGGFFWADLIAAINAVPDPRIAQLEADRAELVKFARSVADDPYEHGVRIQRFKRNARATLSRIGEDGK